MSFTKAPQRPFPESYSRTVHSLTFAFNITGNPLAMTDRMQLSLHVFLKFPAIYS
jgi:hypothetical protein